MMLDSEHKMIIGIIGGRAENTNEPCMALAEEIGRELGKRGITIVCGGQDGIMQAACKGCRENGGTTIGIMKGKGYELANPYIDYVIPTSMDLARNNIIIWTGMGIIAFDGRYGTLMEIALSLDIGKPLMIVGNQDLLNYDSVDAPFFDFYKGYELNQAPVIIDKLLAMIGEHNQQNKPNASNCVK